MARRDKRREQRKKNKRYAFAVYPSAPIDWNRPARFAVVDRGRGRIQKYYFDHLSNYEIRNFWKMNMLEKAEFLDNFFDRHHRIPRCQKGKTVPENLSHVEKVAHVEYNRLIFVVSRWSSLFDIESVKTEHISRFLRQLYPSLLRIYMHQSNCKMKSLEDVTRRKDYENASRFLTLHVARWSGLRYKEVKAGDICYFLEYLYPVIKKLAIDHDNGKLMHLHGFVKVLNKVWLPINEPIFLQ
jgi:hypothetical protein